MRHFIQLGALALTGLTLNAHATNGMNMEAWGAKSAGMGGAAYAFDTGNSAVMNNPATLGLRTTEKADLGVGLTLLMPDVNASHPAAGSSDSDGTAYWMPTLSYIRRKDDLSFGMAMLAQGGMGTEYGAGSQIFAGGCDSASAPLSCNPVAMSGQDIRSEVGFGRLMFPLAWNATEHVTLAGQIDLAWASMDLRMDMDGQSLAGMMGQGLVSGSLLAALPATINYARFNFSDSNPMTGKAKSYGWGYKLGAVWRVNDNFKLGAAYHAKTRMGDMKTDDATIMINGGAMHGSLRVVDFQWPETYGLGVAYENAGPWSWAADLKHIRWSDAMANFRMRFTDAASGMGLDVTMPQNWKDQTVVALGVQYKLSPSVALRAGYNHAANPVPDGTLNPLFPAIVETHYTLGFGYRLDPERSVAASLAYAPESQQTNSSGLISSHSQTTLRVNYNYSF
ncbi:MAG: outer membrane protein transport protein [Pseudomonadota bacterium]|nr:outer membrane protein transport protein [Pseudomonadota bacterium]MDP1903648.1 outer membrane protein transport protein [Pseudomonadota bacterium]MDP2352816.1 outer membrane protein transport protein [Pseudomonadota bacterium]